MQLRKRSQKVLNYHGSTCPCRVCVHYLRSRESIEPFGIQLPYELWKLILYKRRRLMWIAMWNWKLRNLRLEPMAHYPFLGWDKYMRRIPLPLETENFFARPYMEFSMVFDEEEPEVLEDGSLEVNHRIFAFSRTNFEIELFHYYFSKEPCTQFNSSRWNCRRPHTI